MTPSQNNPESNEELDLGIGYIGIAEAEKKQAEKSRRRKEERRKKYKRTKKIVITSICLLSVVLVLMITAFTLILVGKNQMLQSNNAVVKVPETVENAVPEDDGKTITYKGATYKLNPNVTSILCMGIDKNNLDSSQGFGKNGQSDANFLLTIDTATGEINAIAINRDTMVEMKSYTDSGNYIGMVNQQLCLSYANGDGKEKSCENMVDSVSNLFYGIPISSYVAIDLNAIGTLNEAVGNNISVTSPDSFYSSVYGVSFTKGEKTILDSPQKAAAFVRQRDITKLDSNITRMQRQKQYLQRFANAAINKTKEDITFPISLYNIISDYNVNNLNTAKISYLTSCVISGMDNPHVNFLSVKGKLQESETLQNGEKKAEFIVDDQALFELILDVYYQKVG